MVAPLVAAAIPMGLGVLQGLLSHKQQKENYKLQKKIAAYKNELNTREYLLNSNIVSYNEVNTTEDFLTNALATSKDELVTQGSLAVAQSYAQRGGNSADLVEESVATSYGTQQYGLERAYENKMQDIIFDRAKLELSFLGGQTWLPSKPSLFNNIMGGLLNGMSQAVTNYDIAKHGTGAV